MLVDTDSLVDIVFKDAWKQMKVQLPLKQVNTPLYGFFEKPLTLDDSVELPITIGEVRATRTIMIKFLVVDCRSTYNGIMGLPFLHTTRVVSSTYHLALKFLIEMGIGIVLVKQRVV